ncbi:MAG: hypothetical protein ACKESA_00740 [Candidatus Hodgkinia cicadicola]
MEGEGGSPKLNKTWEMKGCPPSTHVIRGKGGPTLTSMHRYHR